MKYLNKGISTPLALSVILTLAVAVGIFTFWQYSEIQKEETNPPEVKIPDKTVLLEEKSSSTDEIDTSRSVHSEKEMTNWKKYRSKILGFSLEFPSNAEVSVAEDYYYIAGKSVQSRPSAHINLSPLKGKDKDLSIKVESPPRETGCENEGEIIEVNGIRFKRTIEKGGEGWYYEVKYCAIETGRHFNINGGIERERHGNLSNLNIGEEIGIFERILSTIKLEKQIIPSLKEELNKEEITKNIHNTWTIYKNKKHNFEVQYPSGFGLLSISKDRNTRISSGSRIERESVFIQMKTPDDYHYSLGIKIGEDACEKSNMYLLPSKLSKTITKETITVNGIEFVKISDRGIMGGTETSGVAVFYFPVNLSLEQEKCLCFEAKATWPKYEAVPRDYPAPEELNTIEQIISTFKFLE